MLWEMKSRRANIILLLLITKAEELDKLYIDQREKNGNSVVELWMGRNKKILVFFTKNGDNERKLCICCLFLDYTLQIWFFFKENIQWILEKSLFNSEGYCKIL